jgi:hypothetical protein
MKRSLRMVATAALACSAFAVLAVVAAAHTARYDSLVSISFQRGHHGESDAFKGKIVSLNDRCERHRTVGVRMRVDGPDPLIGADLTNRDGEWELELASTPAGTYYARARRKVLRRSSNHLHICKPAVSHDLKVAGKP